MKTLTWLLAVGSVLFQYALADKRTCFCEIRQGPDSFSKLLLDVDDPVLKGSYLTCRKLAIWCPHACYTFAKNRLINNGDGDVAPLRGEAGETACSACELEVGPDTMPALHLYATYRVSSCGVVGAHYLGRLCCWEYQLEGSTLYRFNEDCKCGEKPDLTEVSTSTASTDTTQELTRTSVISTTEPILTDLPVDP